MTGLIFDKKVNIAFYYFALSYFSLAFLLMLFTMFNNEQILGINSLIKPLKFSLSIAFYAITMALILPYFSNKSKVKTYTVSAILTLSFEVAIILFQAIRGEKSHFNRENMLGIILYNMMGVVILFFTLHTLYMLIVFTRQKAKLLSPPIDLAVKLGIAFFVIFSLFGGYVSSQSGHSVGSGDSAKGLFFLNWNVAHGDLRVAHFFGLHALQLIPLFGLFISKRASINQSKLCIWFLSIIYFTFVCYTMFQALAGKPFIG